MARRTKEEAGQTRQAILFASLDLFCEKGYSKTTFDEIAKRINLTKGAVYWHFRNKPDLIIAMIQEAFKLVNQHLSKKLPTLNNIDNLKQFFIQDAILIKNHQNYRKFLYFLIFQMEWSEAIVNKANHALSEIRDFPVKQLKETLTTIQKSGEITPSINVDEISEIFFCFWKGAVDAEVSRTSQTDFIELISKGFDLIIKGHKEERQ